MINYFLISVPVIVVDLVISLYQIQWQAVIIIVEEMV